MALAVASTVPAKTLRPKGGRPPHYETAEELQEEIEAYFRHCSRTQEAMTIAGLVDHLGFTSRQSLYDYEQRNEAFSYTIKRAKRHIEAYMAGRLMDGRSNPAGCIFLMKNWFGYTNEDKLLINQQVTVESRSIDDLRSTLETLIDRRSSPATTIIDVPAKLLPSE